VSAPARPGRRPPRGGRGSDFAAELRFASSIAEEAGQLLMDHYERVERISHKSARDVVTEVDHLSERLIMAAIRRTYPADAILAEESGAHQRRDGTAATAATGRTWVIDPLDGTVNYANGIPFFCVSVALVVDGGPAVGIVHDPTRGETFAATSDGPATLGERPIRTSSKARLADYVISLALGGRAVATRTRAVRQAIRIPRSMGSAALALAYVANGRFDAFVQQGGLSVWDIAAAGLIAERSGALVTDAAGGPWFDLVRPPRAMGLVAAPPAHHRTLLELAGGRLARAPDQAPPPERRPAAAGAIR
jgi:myo-inositol-1(or 4)-monophosphatase